MIEVRNNFSAGLNMDDSYYALPNSSYVMALNITRDAVVSNQDRIISNIVGNRIIQYSFPLGTNKCIGACSNPVRNTVVSFVYNSNLYHSIVEYNLSNRTSSKIFENLTDSDGVDVLGFTVDGKICNVNILNRDEGDLLFFLDSLGRPTFMNISQFKAGVFTPVERQIIDVATNWPSIPPTSLYNNDTLTQSNFLQKKLFRFKYRWVFYDNFKSTYSPISSIPLPINILNPDYQNLVTNNNVITVSIQSGPKNVKGIELAVSIYNTGNVFGDFQTVHYFDKSKDSISDDTSFSFDFYNDSTYPFIDVNESILPFSWLPKYADTQELINGNVLGYAAITEGYDNDITPNVVITVDTVAAGDGGSTGSLNAISSFISHTTARDHWKTEFSGVPAPGTIINISVYEKSISSQTLFGTVTTVAGDIASTVATKMRLAMIAAGRASGAILVSGNTVYWTWSTDYYDNPVETEVIAPSTVTGANSIATWPFSGQRTLGIQYYDEKGRTNGVLYSEGITFPPYSENGSNQVLLPYINVKIYHAPPDWASTYQLLFNKDDTQILYIETVDVLQDTNYLYFEITNLFLNAIKNPTTAAVVSWTFQDGDRMRLIKKTSNNSVFDYTYNSAIEGIVADPNINGSIKEDKTYIKIRKATPFSSVDYSSKYFIIQLYRPSFQKPSDGNEVFYECAVEYPIITTPTGVKVHGGQITDQSDDFVTPAEINVYDGDVYFRQRTEVLGESGVGIFYIQDRNFVDFFVSAVSNIDGRPSTIDINAKTSFFPVTIRFGQSYQHNTNINGLNIFYPNDFQDCDNSYGQIQRMKVRARFMRVYQELKVGVIYLFSKIGKSQSGDEVTIVTDELLNPITYYNFDTGIGDNKESLASFNESDYFTSSVTGGIYRVSLDGITPLHINYKMNSWATSNIPRRTGSSHIYGTFDQKLNNYIISLESSILVGSLAILFQGKFGAHPQYYFFTVTGSPNAGDIVTTSLINGASQQYVYSYTFKESQSKGEGWAELANIINSDGFFTAEVASEDQGLLIQQLDPNLNPDIFNGSTTITLGEISDSPAQTLCFSEEDNSFESFVSYLPDYLISIGTLLCSFKDGSFYTHDDENNYNTFYGINYESSVTTVFNSGSPMKKQPMAITENATSIWDCPQIVAQSMSYGNTNQETTLIEDEFEDFESTYSASIKRDINSAGGKWNGDFIKGAWMLVKFRNQNTSALVALESAIVNWKESNINNR